MKERYAALIAKVYEDESPVNDEMPEPRRWLTLTRNEDGREAFLASYDSQGDALKGLADEYGEWGPVALWDLETGASYPLHTHVTVTVDASQPLLEPNLTLPELEWTVIAVYPDTNQRFASVYEATDAATAEKLAVEDVGPLIVAGVIPGAVELADVSYAT